MAACVPPPPILLAHPPARTDHFSAARPPPDGPEAPSANLTPSQGFVANVDPLSQDGVRFQHDSRGGRLRERMALHRRHVPIHSAGGEVRLREGREGGPALSY